METILTTEHFTKFQREVMFWLGVTLVVLGSFAQAGVIIYNEINDMITPWSHIIAMGLVIMTPGLFLLLPVLTIQLIEKLGEEIANVIGSLRRGKGVKGNDPAG